MARFPQNSFETEGTRSACSIAVKLSPKLAINQGLNFQFHLAPQIQELPCLRFNQQQGHVCDLEPPHDLAQTMYAYRSPAVTCVTSCKCLPACIKAVPNRGSKSPIKV
mmetsp:Transcript_18019/g.27868  ORF Transcript_18019/g.27868 Transcript_18019/m.27868 type:complete len:108 (-) Transcript_18019:1261-1584(-)